MAPIFFPILFAIIFGAIFARRNMGSKESRMSLFFKHEMDESDDVYTAIASEIDYGSFYAPSYVSWTRELEKFDI